MLLGLWGVATTWCAGCQLGETLPPRPVVPPREALVNQQASDGCTRFALKVVNGVARVEALYNTNGCHTDELQLLADSAPTYTAATGTLRVPIVLKNVGGVAVMAPARIRFNADSSQFLNAQGQVIAGTPNILATNYDTANAGGRNGQWRYDTVLAVSGQPQLLLPGASSRRKWLEFTGSDWTQAVRIKVPTVATQVGGVVPAYPPDSTPVGLFADSNVVTDSVYLGVPILKDVVSLEFVDGTPQSVRQALIDSVAGLVVGGIQSSTTTGMYYVKVLGAPSLVRLHAVIVRLRASSAVDEASVVMTVELRSDSIRPVDGNGWSAWKVLPSFASSGKREALERLRAPMAWGCSVGDSTVPIAVVDNDFRSSNDLRFNATLSRGVGTIATGEHGTKVASILGARGNDSSGMTGVLWRSDLRAYERQIGNNLPGLAGTFKLIERAFRDGARVVNVSASIAQVWNSPPVPPATAIAFPWHGGNQADSIVVRAVDSLYRAMIRRIRARGADPLLVVAAGNFTNIPARDAFWSGWGTLKRQNPGNVLIVGATSAVASQLLSVSGRGPQVTVAALGEGVFAATQGNPEGSPWNGTSFSAPQVTGIAGLLRSFDPRLTTADIVQLIEQGALNGLRSAGGIPLADAYESLKLAATRPGAPLCGNRVWTNGTQIFVNRGTASEPIATPSGGFVTNVAVAHGGKYLEWLGVGQSGGLSWNANGTWSNGPATGNPYLGTTLSRLSQSHDADSILHVAVSGTPPSLFVEAQLGDGYGPTRYFPVAPYIEVPTNGDLFHAAFPLSDDTALVAVSVSTYNASAGTFTFSGAAVHKLSLSSGAASLLWQESGRGIRYLGFSEDGQEIYVGYVVTNALTSQPLTAVPGCKTVWRNRAGLALDSADTPYSCSFSWSNGTGTGRFGGASAPRRAPRRIP